METRPQFDQYIEEHKELYLKLDYFLKQFTSLKNKQDDEFLFQISAEFYNYVDELLSNHFKDEEENLFPGLKGKLEAEILERIIKDHEEIRAKFSDLKKAIESYKLSGKDYKAEVLFPSYNLIATINHHAQREDREIFSSS